MTATATTSARLGPAISYARRGWRVFPCEPRGKKPYGLLAPHGLLDATDDPSTIESWWSTEPAANIGIATGSSSGFWALDIDARNGGVESWLTVTADRTEPRTAIVRTPSGGWHFYFTTPTNFSIRNSAGKVAPGIDTRGDGGYVVAAGSETETGIYRWDGSSIVEPAPDWLLDLIVPRKLGRETCAADGTIIPAGQRNATLTSLAGSMRRRGMSPAAILAALHAENEIRCAPPLNASELDGIVTSVGRYSPDSVSAALSVGVAAERILRFTTAAELALETPAEPVFVIPGYVAVGSITELTGGAKTGGKTTWLAHAVQAVLDGRSFLGHAAHRTPVVWLTEERRGTFAEALKRAGLLGRADLHLLHWHDTNGAEWPDLIAATIAHCRTVGATLLIVDTLPQFSGLKGDAENNSGDALRAIEPLQRAAAEGLAVIVVRHDRKGGGAVGESGRGSSAFTGAVDIVVSIRRPEGQPRPTVRVLHALSRFQETPETLVVELTDTGYVALGAETTVAVLDAKRIIFDSLPTDEAAAITLDEIQATHPIKRTVLQAALKELGGQIVRIGNGRRGRAYRYFRAIEVSAATQITRSGRNRNDDLQTETTGSPAQGTAADLPVSDGGVA